MRFNVINAKLAVVAIFAVFTLVEGAVTTKEAKIEARIAQLEAVSSKDCLYDHGQTR